LVLNRIPKQLSIAKSSKEFKALNCGDSICHTFHYKTLLGRNKKAGLVAWKDCNMVYCLTNDTSTVEMGECKRRGQGGIITLKRPEVISKYNQYMGGADVADMRRIQLQFDNHGPELFVVEVVLLLA
jgi:hypothetical protein